MGDSVEYFVFHSPCGWLIDGWLTNMDAHGRTRGLANHLHGLLRWNQNLISVQWTLKDNADETSVNE